MIRAVVVLPMMLVQLVTHLVRHPLRSGVMICQLFCNVTGIAALIAVVGQLVMGHWWIAAGCAAAGTLLLFIANRLARLQWRMINRSRRR